MGTKKIEKKKEVTKNTNTLPKSRLLEWVLQNGTYTVCILLSVILLVLFAPYMLGDKLFLFTGIGSDTVNSWWPEFVHLTKYIRQEGIPTWSFAYGLGQNVFPAHLETFPLGLIYLFSPAGIPAALAYLHLIQIFLGGLFFYLFLRKVNISVYSSVIGGVLYAFTGFMVVGSTWYSFATDAFYIAFMFYALELVRKNNNYLAFPLAVALLAVFPVQLYHTVLLLALYLVACFVKDGYDKSYYLLTGKLVLLGIVGVSMSAALSLGNLFQMLDSPRGTGSASYTDVLASNPIFHTGTKLYFQTFLLRMFGNDMAGYSSDYKGWYNYLEAPLEYTGILTVLLLPQMILLGNRKIKWMAAGVLFIALFAVVFPYFRHIFWLFTGDYFRTYSLFFSIVKILLALLTLDFIIRHKTIHIPVLLFTSFCICLIVLAPDISEKSLALVVFFVVTAEVMLLWFVSRKESGPKALLALQIAVVAEVLIFSWGALNERNVITKTELTQRTGYNDYTHEAVQYLAQTDKSFYRIHKNYYSGTSNFVSINDALMQGYNSSMSYHSFNQKNYVRFLQRMEVISRGNEMESRWLGGLNIRPVLMQLVSNKYYLRRATNQYPPDGAAEAFINFAYQPLAKLNGIEIYRNKYFLPLGFTYDKVMSETEMDSMGKFRDITMLRAAVVSDKEIGRLAGMERFSVSDTILNLTAESFDSITNLLKRDTLQITSFTQKHITGSIATTADRILYFSIPYDKGWQIKVDGQQVQPIKVNYGFVGLVLKPGQHRVELHYWPRYLTAGIAINCFGLLVFAGMCLFQVYKRLKKPTLHA